jgi:hypothetical protein
MEGKNNMKYNFTDWTLTQLRLELSKRMAELTGDWFAPVSKTRDEYAHALRTAILARRS